MYRLYCRQIMHAKDQVCICTCVNRLMNQPMSSRSSRTTCVFIDVFLERNDQVMHLEPRERVRLQAVCRAAVRQLCPCCVCSTWLAKHERHISHPRHFWLLHNEFVGSRVMRSYLRQVCLVPGGGCIIAGGFALEHFLSQDRGYVPWVSNDIDIFVDTKSNMYRLQHLFFRYVNECGFALQYRNSEHVRCDRRCQCLHDVRRQLQTITQGAGPDRSVSEQPHLLNASASLDNLPSHLRQPAYSICRSLRLAHTGGHAGVLHTMRAITLHLVARHESPEAAIDAEFICRNFDMEQCAFALTVSEEHTFEVQGFGDAVTLARNDRIRYNATAFSKPSNAVEKQLQRAHKYYLRGMSF